MLFDRRSLTALLLFAATGVIWSISILEAPQKKQADKSDQQSQTTMSDKPQTPKPPFPYIQREITYKNTSDHVTLNGTLTIPAGKGPHPVVLLLPGSGPVDRNETMLPGHKPFLLVADYLTRRGVAVLRVDDRGAGKSTGDYLSSTCEDLAGDALAALEFLKRQPEIDKNRIGLVGHSQGAIVAPMVIARSSDVSFAVFLAIRVLPERANMRLILRASLKAKGAPEKEIRRISALYETYCERLTDCANDASLRPLVYELTEAVYPAGEPLPKKQIEDLVESQLPRLHSRYVRFLIQHDPRGDLRRVRIPLLAITGSLDTAAPAQENLGALLQIMREDGNGDATVIELYGINHLMQTVQTDNPLESMQIEETFSPKVLEIMAAWIRSRTGLAQ